MAKRATTAAVNKSPLSAALDHAMIATTGPANYAEYCNLSIGWVISYDGIIATGHRVAEDLQVAPHVELFRYAVLRAGSPYSITKLSSGNIRVRGNKVGAEIPCFPLASLPNVLPDSPIFPVTANLSSVLVDVSKLIEKKADSIVGSSILLRENSAVATDGGTIVEGWHGLQLPVRLVLPREFADALYKAKGDPTHCGWSNETFTVWYGEDKWIRTSLYPDNYPDIDVHFARMRMECGDDTFRPVPVDLLQAIETLKPFRETGELALFDYGLNTRKDGLGTSMSFEHYWPYRGEYPASGLRMTAAHGAWITFCRFGSFWYGPVIRGVTSLAQ